MTAPTGRARTPAAPRGHRWVDDGACRETGPEVFFADAKDDRDAARRVCAGCPVIAPCLTTALEQDDVMYPSGIAGGLSPDQRRALRGEERLGQRPDLDVARQLASGRLAARLLVTYRQEHGSLAATTRLVQASGIDASEVTVRVALWWLGECPSRVEPARVDGRPMRVKLRKHHVGEIRRLRDAGATNRDVAVYLGVASTTVSVVVQELEAVENAAALDAIFERLAA